MKDFELILKHLNLNEMDRKVFTGLLETGPSPASIVAKHTSLGRVTVYETLKRLVKKGLVKTTIKKGSKVRNFIPAGPETIEAKLVSQQSSITEALAKLPGLAPLLLSYSSEKSTRPEVLFFEGLDGVKQAVLDTVEQKPSEILSFSNSNNFNDVLGLEFLESYFRQRKERGILTKGIIPRTPKGLSFYNRERNAQDLRIVRYVPQEWYKFNDLIYIYKHSVSISSLEPANEHSVIIRSKSIANAFRFLFDLVWNTVAQEK